MDSFNIVPGIPVLIYDDESQWDILFRDELRKRGYAPAFVDTLEQFRRHFENFDPSKGAIIIDSRLERGYLGTDVVRFIRDRGFRGYVLGVFSGEGDEWNGSYVDDVFDKSRCFSEEPVAFGNWFHSSFLYHSNGESK